MSDLRAYIMRGDAESDSAVYYVLRYRMFESLKREYLKMRLQDELCDVLLDFFFYLRDGKNKCNERPYVVLEGLRSWLSFEPFVLRIFKRFLLDRYDAEVRANDTERLYGHIPSTEYDKVRDQRIHCLGLLFAYVDSDFEPRNRFIFYRSMLNDLDRSLMIGNEKMAEAMGCSYANYRQIDCRCRALAKSMLADFVGGVVPTLDARGLLLAERVERDFENLAEVVKDLYTDALCLLDCKEAIEALRASDRENASARYSRKTSMGNGDIKFSIEDRDCGMGDFVRFRRRCMPEDQFFTPDLVMDFADMNKKGKLWNWMNSWLSALE